MKWDLSETAGECYKAVKDNGLSAFIYRVAVWQDFRGRGGAPAYDVRYKGSAVARIVFENKGATVKALPGLLAFPEISDLDLVEIALWVSKLRAAAAPVN